MPPCPVRALVSALALASLATACGGDPRAGIDAALAAAVARDDVPMVVAVATDRAGVIYEGAFGESAPGDPVTADRMFRIASMTKPVTSVAAMQLVELGLIGLDDPVADHLPALGTLPVFTAFDEETGHYEVEPAHSVMTIRHLLSHTSGLSYDFTSEIRLGFRPRAGDSFADVPLLFEPGASWHYGTSTDWVGTLVERVSGQRLDAYFREHILDPLGMHDTRFGVSETEWPRVVREFRRYPDGSLVAPPQTPWRETTTYTGGGNLIGTAADYARLVRMFLNDGELDGVRVLTPESVVAMTTNQIGRAGVPLTRSTQPARSNDFAFVKGAGRDKFGFGFLINAESEPGLRSAGSLSWGGIWNTYFWFDQTAGVGGVFMTQFYPFADTRALATLEAFERAVYALVRPSRRSRG
jgi:methyl acetate hydrolase